MADITITIPNPSLQRVVDGVCGFFNYQAFLPQLVGDPIPNPETKTQFAKRMVREQVAGWVRAYEAISARQTAEQTTAASVDAIGISVS